MSKSSDRSPARRVLWIVAVSAMGLVAACGGGDDGGDGNGAAATADASPPTGASNGDGLDAVLLDVDPCELLTIPEAEAAIGPGVAAGVAVDGENCTFSVEGGGGTVSVTIEDPEFCDAIERSLGDGTAAGSGLEVIDVGDGGVADVPTSTVRFLIGGGCISLNTGISGVRLDLAELTALAEAAAGHVG